MSQLFRKLSLKNQIELINRINISTDDGEIIDIFEKYLLPLNYIPEYLFLSNIEFWLQYLEHNNLKIKIKYIPISVINKILYVDDTISFNRIINRLNNNNNKHMNDVYCYLYDYILNNESWKILKLLLNMNKNKIVDNKLFFILCWNHQFELLKIMIDKSKKNIKIIDGYTGIDCIIFKCIDIISVSNILETDTDITLLMDNIEDFFIYLFKKLNNKEFIKYFIENRNNNNNIINNTINNDFETYYDKLPSEYNFFDILNLALTLSNNDTKVIYMKIINIIINSEIYKFYIDKYI